MRPGWTGRRGQLLIVPALAIGALTCGCGARRLPFYGQVQDFQLTSQTGRHISLSELKGKVWIADTFYTTCTGPCPMMTSRMRRIGQEVARVANIRLISFTVDPDHDKPDVMLRYAGNFHADPERWFFLTGPMTLLNRIAMNDLHLCAIDGSLDHSTQFALVDSNSAVRGYYLPFDQKQMKQLISDAKFLAGA